MSTIMLTFHGGSSSTSINNVGAYNVVGDVASPASPFYALQPEQIANFGALPAVRELRGIVAHPTDGTLLVANAYKEFNQILQFTPTSAPGVVEFSAIYAQKQVNHPFDIVFAFEKYLFVSNQDAVSDNGPAITYYPRAGADGKVFPTSRKFGRLRGLASDGKYLYVAGAEAGKTAGCLFVFGPNGALVTSHPLDAPVHLLYDGARYVYIGDEAKDCVYLYDTASGTAPTPLVEGHTGLEDTAGLALLPLNPSSAKLLVASRKGKAVLAYPITLGTPPRWDGTYTRLLGGLADWPEFIFVVP